MNKLKNPFPNDKTALHLHFMLLDACCATVAHRWPLAVEEEEKTTIIPVLLNLRVVWLTCT